MKHSIHLKNAFLTKAFLIFSLIFSIPAFAQTKWEASGNNAANTDFIGTNNNVDFIIKTNGSTAAKIKADGSFLLKSLESHGTGIAAFDNDGKLLGLSFNGDHNKVLSGDGAWSTISDLSIQGLKFDNTSGISFSKTNGIRTFAYGKRGGTPVYRSYCAAPAASTTNHLFGGMIQIYNADSTGNIVPGSGLLNFQTFPGTSSIDASIEGTTAGGGLLLNYFCGNNTFINTGSNGGDVMITSPTLGKVGIGITPTEKLDVAGNIKLNSNTLYLKNDVYHGLKYTTSFGGTTMDGPVLFGYSNGALGTTGGGSTKVALFWDENGKVGIGNNTPSDLLQIGDGSNRLVSGTANSADLDYGTSYIGFNAARNGNGWNVNTDGNHNGGAVIFSNIFGDMFFSTVKTNSANSQTKTDAEILASTKLFIAADGNVAIGTINTAGYKLSVNGNVRAKDIIVQASGWSDFVFAPGYVRMSLLDKEIYYTSEKHLPNVDKEQTILANGLHVEKTMNGMMQNIEENTLDLVELYKKLLALEKDNIELKEIILQLKAENEGRNK